jgi:DNA-binding NtrC family response regulator
VLEELSNAGLYQLFEEWGFVTRSPAMLPILRMARKAALVSDVTVLLEGESGTGKQVLAHAIHQLDKKRGRFPFVTVHCSTISEGIAESELFGHQRGSFSGATRDRQGLFQAAHRGTVFLDDINDLPLALQPKLLDVLQRGTVRGVGADREASVDVRIIAAANQPLAQVVQDNRFRSDLYHRLNVVRLPLPPLRKRTEDLPPLMLAFARRHQHIFPHITEVESELTEFLRVYPFGGNVRELEHAVERMLFAKTEGHSLKLSDWQAQGNGDLRRAEDLGANQFVSEAARCLWIAICEHGVSFNEALRQLERTLLATAVGQTGQTRREIADRLHTSERTLYHKLRSHNLKGHAVAP